MPTTRQNNTIKLILTLAVLGLAAGCASDTKKAPDAKKAADSEYEWVTPTGSRMAVKVKKGTTIGATADGKGSDTLRTQQDMAREVRYDPKTSGN